MSKSLVLSLYNRDFLNEENILIAGEWVLEKHDNNLNKVKYDIFYSKSEFKDNRIKNFKESAIIYKNILKDLSTQLSKIHSVELSIKSWTIILGPWLKRFVELCYQKDFLIKEILKNYEIKKIYGIKNNKYKKYSNDTYAIHPNSRDILWNNNLFAQLIDFYNFKVEKNFSHFETEKDLVKEYRKSVLYNKNLIKKLIFFLFSQLNFLRKKNDALIIGTGFSFIFEKLFELSFFQSPQFNKIDDIEYKKFDNKLRSKINFDFSKENKNVENFIKSILSEYLPLCFLEDFNTIYKNCHKNYPTKPKFILTGLHQDFDENFKFFTAKMINQGVPYFVLQHGNTYFVEDFVLNRPEYDSCDKFFTFGYLKDEKFVSFCNPKTFGKFISYKKKNGRLNILAPPMLGLFFPFERNQEFLRSFELISKFGEKIDKGLKDKVTLRLHPNFSTSRGLWFKNKYLHNFNNNQIDYGIINYKNFLSESKLNIFFYDSSGILENLHYNIPTVAIWSDKQDLMYNHINDDFIKQYDLLKDANIIFDDLENMINHVSKYWDHIDKWWLSKKTQSNIKEFNKRLNLKPRFFSFVKLRQEILKYLRQANEKY